MVWTKWPRRNVLRDARPGSATNRQGSAPGVDASGTVVLIELRFRVTQAATSQMAFQSPDLLDDQLQPQPIPGIQWFGGTIVGN